MGTVTRQAIKKLVEHYQSNMDVYPRGGRVRLKPTRPSPCTGHRTGRSVYPLAATPAHGSHERTIRAAHMTPSRPSEPDRGSNDRRWLGTGCLLMTWKLRATASS